MSLTKNILIVVLVWALVGASNVLAKSHVHGDHHQHQITTVSPFDGDKEDRSLSSKIPHSSRLLSSLKT